MAAERHNKGPAGGWFPVGRTCPTSVWQWKYQAEECQDPRCGCRGKQPSTQEEWEEAWAKAQRSQDIYDETKEEEEEERRVYSPGRDMDEIEKGIRMIDIKKGPEKGNEGCQTRRENKERGENA